MDPIAELKQRFAEQADINEMVLESAAKIRISDSAPEMPDGAEDMVVWNECAADCGHRVNPVYDEDGTITEQLVRAGCEEADIERRLAADYRHL